MNRTTKWRGRSGGLERSVARNRALPVDDFDDDWLVDGVRRCDDVSVGMSCEMRDDIEKCKHGVIHESTQRTSSWSLSSTASIARRLGERTAAFASALLFSSAIAC